MSRTRGSKIKALRSNPYEDLDVFYMDLEEAKSMIASRFEFDTLAERHERQRVKRMKPAQG